MRRHGLLCAAVSAWALVASQAVADGLQQPQLVAPATSEKAAQLPAGDTGVQTTSYDDAAAPKAEEKSSCGCEKSSDASCGCESSCGCEASCGCPSCGCSSCGCGLGCCDVGKCWPFCCCCDLGEPCTLQKELTPCCCDVTYGGWVSMGYVSNNVGLSQVNGDALDMNDVPDRLNLDQSWLWVEKKAKTDSCCCDWGYRADVMYGTDGDQIQSFGNQNNGWDKSFDHGVYGWAIPQAYAELGWNDWSIKMGRFFTPMGYEVVPDTGNFFYTHSLTFFNSEPFGHTGVLGTYVASECMTWYAGWTLGWDTGFDSFDGGSNWLGGFSRKLNDNVTFTYISTAGNFGFRSNGTSGYNQSVVLDAKISSKTEYVLQSDWTRSDGLNGANFNNEQDYGIDQYLFYTINDCWKAGTRVEWWKSNQVTGEETSFYELTGGVNYKPHANVIVRPEVRYDWSPSDTSLGGNYNRVIFGIDSIFTF